MKITILGSSGQIGEHLTKYLRDRGHTVNEFDWVNNPSQDMTLIPNQLLENVINDCDFVFFLAFDVGGSRYLKKYQHTFQFVNNNCRLMTNTFTLLEKYNKKFVFVSTQMSNMGHSPYGILKRVGELYTKSLKGLIVKAWNVYGLEKDYEKSHVITDFIRKGFQTGVIDMITDGQEEREFLYVEDYCEAMEIIMNNYEDFSSEDNLHITSFESIKIIDISSIVSEKFNDFGKKVKVVLSEQQDTVQMDQRNKADPYILNWWNPKTSIHDGISNIFDIMKEEYLLSYNKI